MHVVGTAGHVDHGKSTLVLALTGRDPDRFAEEKERGLTIDLGFAWTTLPSGAEVAFVDVPGHVRFLKNMLAGVGAVDACLFVVAATEGWKPQSEEHLRILELLGIGHGLITLTKVGLVDDDRREKLARLEIEERVEKTFLAGAEVVEVDAVAGVGLDELRMGLDRLLATTPVATDRGRPRLWIDRVFAAKGSGTVVTGTLTGGVVAVGDELVAVPGDLIGRVRGLQSHEQPRNEIGPGHRVAVNLAGIDHHQLHRGIALVRADQWTPTTRIDASLSVLDSVGHQVSRRGAFQAYVGLGEHAVKVRVLGSESLAPGASGLVRLHLSVALPLLPGDRYVLRESGRDETVGGGEVLDVAPLLPASQAAPDRSVDRVIAEHGWIEPDKLERLTGDRRDPNVGRWVVDPAALEAAQRALVERVRAAPRTPFTERERAVRQSMPHDAFPSDATQDPRSDPWFQELEANPFTPPPPTDRAMTRELVRQGHVVEADGIFFAAEAIGRAIGVVAGLLAASPEGVTVAEIRAALGTTRKYALPLVGHLDATGVTRRRGDLRIAGPRLPSVG